MQERDAFLALYPQGYHKTDKMVGGARGRRLLVLAADSNPGPGKAVCPAACRACCMLSP